MKKFAGSVFISCVIGFVCLIHGITNFFWGGAVTKSGWVRANNPEQKAVVGFSLGIIFLLLSLFLYLRKKRNH